MGELYRSEEMQLIQLFFQVEAAHDIMDELGELGMVEFKDLNPNVNSFQRTFVKEVKRFDDLLNKLKNFAKQLDTDDLRAEVEEVVLVARNSERVVPEIDELEAKIEDIERELLQTNNNQDLLRRNYMELVELKHVLIKDDEFFAGADASSIETDEPFVSEDPSSMLMTARGISRLGYITGVLPHASVNTFERILWRITRGNLYMKHSSFLSPIGSKTSTEATHEEKDVFIIFFQGDRAEARIRKICEAVQANIYPCPNNSEERREMLTQVKARLKDLKEVFDKSVQRQRRILLHIAANMEAWAEQLVKEKSIYVTMNKCNYDIGRKCLIAEGWCPLKAVDDVRDALKRADERSGAPVAAILNTIKTKETPPTYFKTNKFTSSFQGIVDSYGIARYREVNPGVFTIVTFPFLFGMMFGDVGHGIIMLLLSAWFCLKEDWLQKVKLNEMIKMLFDGRYMLLLMSLAGIYCGALYNEVFSIPMDVFGSRWAFYEGEPWARDTHPAIAYPFGVDPAWKGAKNELTYYNSIKMKLSIIFGVVQMLFGIILSAHNAIFFKKPYNFWFEFVPQILFMSSIFGYLCFLVVLKWCINWSHTPAPGLLNLLINMFLSPAQLQPGDEIFSGQLYLQWLLLFIAAISVPWMLLPKPLLLRRDHLAKHGYRPLPDHIPTTATTTSTSATTTTSHASSSSSSSSSSSASSSHQHHRQHHDGHAVDAVEYYEDGDDDEEEEFDFGEIFIHQTIHTIEFVLGAISNTASYLRLWALSLAHSELATVFWERAFVLALSTNSALMIFGGFAVWAVMTAAVLLAMESLSAFLHALRLHWVEFQNKFYMGDGYAFDPFSYQRLLDTVADPEKS